MMGSARIGGALARSGCYDAAFGTGEGEGMKSKISTVVTDCYWIGC